MKRASQKPFDGVPYTRLAASLIRPLPAYGLKTWSFQGLTLAGRRFGTFGLFVRRLFGQAKRLQLRHLLTRGLAGGLIFHHGPGALFGALFLLETRFGAGLHFIGPGFTSSGCHNCLLLRRDCAGTPIITLLCLI